MTPGATVVPVKSLPRTPIRGGNPLLTAAALPLYRTVSKPSAWKSES